MQEQGKSAAEQAPARRIWKPEGEPRAIVQIVHGMAEYIDCYEETATRLNRAGLLVVGHNHRGHGPDAERLGWFGPGGFDALVEDVHTVRQETQREYPEIPYFLLGHSMGSFVARNYCLKHEEGLRGVVLSGTGHFPPGLVNMGLFLANLLCLFGGETKPAKLIETVSFAGYNKEWAPPRTSFDWISRNEEKVDRYIADPLCGFTFTAGAYRDMFRGLQNLYPDKLTTMDQDIPVLLYSGASDPVGGRGQGVQTVAAELKAAV